MEFFNIISSLRTLKHYASGPGEKNDTEIRPVWSDGEHLVTQHILLENFDVCEIRHPVDHPVAICAKDGQIRNIQGARLEVL